MLETALGLERGEIQAEVAVAMAVKVSPESMRITASKPPTSCWEVEASPCRLTAIAGVDRCMDLPGLCPVSLAVEGARLRRPREGGGMAVVLFGSMWMGILTCLWIQESLRMASLCLAEEGVALAGVYIFVVDLLMVMAMSLRMAD